MVCNRHFPEKNDPGSKTILTPRWQVI